MKKLLFYGNGNFGIEKNHRNFGKQVDELEGCVSRVPYIFEHHTQGVQKRAKSTQFTISGFLVSKQHTLN